MSGEIVQVLNRLDRLGCRPVVVASHPRSGTHLCIDTLRLNFAECASRKSWLERVDRLYLDLDLLSRTPKERQAGLLWDVLRRTSRPVIKTHALPDFAARFWDDAGGYDPQLIQWLRDRASWLYVYRDGRPAICSWQNFLIDYDPAAKVPIATFLRQSQNGTSRVRAWAEHVKSWVGSNAHCFSMEDLLSRSFQTVEGIAAHVGIAWAQSNPLRPTKASAAFLCRLKRRLVRSPQSTAISAGNGHERPVDWREAFTASDREFFERESDGLLLKLGYETSSRWASRGKPAPRTQGDDALPFDCESLAEASTI